MPDGTPPFRADHVGSLLRPAALAEARERWRAGRLPHAELQAIEDEAVRAAAAMQEGLGLQGVTDGEYRRDYWHLDFMFGFDGVVPGPEKLTTKFSEGVDFTANVQYVEGRIAYPKDGIMRRDFAFLKEATSRTAKMTVPSPAMFRHRSGRGVISETAYPDIEDFWTDLGAAYNAAVKDFAALGCTYLQLDDVNTCVLCDQGFREMLRGQDTDPDELLGLYVRLNNAATAGRPAGMRITMHMCRGNYMSTFAAEGGYEAIAERVLAETDVDGFFMEYDDPRSGDFAPLRFLPKGKFAVLGLVSTKTPTLESKDTLKQRIEEAARYAPLDQLCLSPQCGFASTREGNRITEDDQRRKLALVVEVAGEVWGSL